MSFVSGFIGSVVIIACVVRGVVGFINDVKTKTSKEETK